MSLLDSWRLLCTVLPGPRRRVIVIGLLSFVASLIEAAILVVVVQVAVALASDGTSSTTAKLRVPWLEVRSPGISLLVAGLAALAIILLHVGLSSRMAALARDIFTQTRTRAVHGFANAPWHVQSLVPEGALQEVVSSLSVQSAAVGLQFSAFVAGCMAVLALLATALIVQPLASLAILVIGGVVSVLLRPLAHITGRGARAVVKESTAFAEEVGQWTGLAMEMQAFGVMRAETERLDGLVHQSSKSLYRARFAGRLASLVYKDISIFLLIVVIAIVYATSTGGIPDVGAVAVLVVRAVVYAQTAQSAHHSVTELGPNLDLLVRRIADLEQAFIPPGTRHIDRIDAIEFDDVSYTYDGTRPALANVSFTLEPGTVTGVIGPSGAGKSTLVQLLLGLRAPSSGEIRVGGIRTDQIDPDSWHRQVAFVPQEPHLYRASVADNISFHREDVGREAVEQATRDAHVAREVLALPDGFDTVLGPRGGGLSGGQKQRVAIARALAGHPSLLVLDEPTSALDQVSEQLIQQTINELRGRVTLVIIAHRLSTVSSCDRILTFDQGRCSDFHTLDQAVAHLERREPSSS